MAIKKLLPALFDVGDATEGQVFRVSGGRLTKTGSGMVFKDNGRMGISTAAPGAKLEIETDSNTTKGLIVDANSSVYAETAVTIGCERTSSDAYTLLDCIIDSDGTPVSALKVRGDGRVGIGITAPTKLLHVKAPASLTGGVIGLLESSDTANGWLQIKGNAGNSWEIGVTNSGFQFYDDETTSYKVTIKNNGNVGIGTTSPAQALHVAGGNLSTIRNNMFGITSNTPAAGGETNAYHNAYYDTTNSREEYLVADEACKIQFVNGQINFRTAAAGSADGAITWINAMGILADGKVGIGNTDPAAPLTVTADSGANAFALRARPNDDYSFIQFYNNAGSALRGQIL